MRHYLDVFLTTLTMIAAFTVGGLVVIGLLWVAKQVL